MTQNQIDFYKAKETERHNLAMESETNRSNLANEAIQRGNLDVNRQAINETSRHNRVTEANEWYYKSSSIQLGYDQLRANEWMNQQTAEHYERQDAINAQHYSNQDMIGAGNLAENVRHNQMNEKLAREQNAINWKNAASQALSAQSAYLHGQASMISAESQSRLNEASIAKMNNDASLQWANYAMNHDKYLKYLEMDQRANKVNVKYTQAQTGLTKANIANTKAQTDLTKQRTRNQFLTNVYDAVTLGSRVSKAEWDTAYAKSSARVQKENAKYSGMEHTAGLVDTWTGVAGKVVKMQTDVANSVANGIKAIASFIN